MQYLREYLDKHPDSPPVDHVIVFDEAQRAWDAAYGKKKFNRSKSEPALFLEIMDRHDDWAVIVALVGSGQEINRGERGLSEWSAALTARNAIAGKHWNVAAASDAISGGEATAWQSLFGKEKPPAWVKVDDRLHLDVAIRSYRCLEITTWVNALLEGKVEKASDVARAAEFFPVLTTRSLPAMRSWLKESTRGSRRYGLVASSGARRLRAEGLGVSLSATKLNEVAHWYLGQINDIQSSFALEVTANEYTCQGLELDYVGMCWDGDLIWNSSNSAWQPRKISGSNWQTIKNPDVKTWALNKYRVLLTRARIGMVIWVPKGDYTDKTRDPRVLDEIFEILCASGAQRF